MGGILWLLLLCMALSGSVLGRQPEGENVARRVRVSRPLVLRRLVGYRRTFSRGVDSQPMDIARREWKGKSSAEEVNSRCTKQQEVGTVRARPAKGVSFSKGAWEQFPNAPPILPFNASDEQHSGAANQLDPVHVASFSLTDFQSGGGGGASGKGALGVSGYLLLEITTSKDIDNNRFRRFYNFSNDEAFQSHRGYSALKIDLEGLMHETKEEITVCMLGCTMLPSSSDSVSLLEEDCNVMFQMQYPKKLSLTRSVIRAEVTSLLNAGEKHHFHPINVTALPSRSHMLQYEYTAADVIDPICSNFGAETLPLEEDSSAGFALEWFFRSSYFRVFDVQPSLDCSKSEAFCDNMGPLGSTVGQGENLPHSTLAIPVFTYTGISAAEIDVSAVLQLHHDGGGGRVYDDYEMFMLNNRTLVAEGFWKSETQQICMVACPAEVVIANVSRDCNIRICLQFETGLTLEKRNIISGTISSTLLDNKSDAFNPLSFSMPLHRLRHFGIGVQRLSHYTFNHIEEAHKFREKFKRDNAQSAVKTTVFRYPTLHGNDSNDYIHLSEGLSINSLLIQRSAQDQNLRFQFEVIAIGDHLTIRGESFMVLDTMNTEPLQAPLKINPLKLAAQLRISEGHWYDLQEAPTVVYAAEGLYEPNDGKMYMVGCRPVKASWSVLQDNKKSLNGSLDCSLTLYLEFPSKIGAWLSSATVKVSIQSTRTAADPFHFNPIYYETFPIMYKEQRNEIFSRRNVEGALSVAALSVMLFGIVVQLFHINRNQDSASFISLTMLGLQGIGYMIPLLTEVEALLARTDALQLQGFESPYQHVKLIIKFLTLVILLLMLLLIQRVWKKRNTQAHKTATVSLTLQKNLPQETKVILICGLVHFMSFLSILFIHAAVTKSHEQPLNTAPFVQIHPTMSETTSMTSDFLLSKWKEYWQNVEDLFLFPQVVGNALWNVKGKPLHPMYYMGSTVVQLLPHLYHRFSAPVYYPHDSYNYPYADVDADFFTRDNKIVIPLLAIVLMSVVYIQQKWNGWLVLSRPRSYSRLPVKNTETELVS